MERRAALALSIAAATIAALAVTLLYRGEQRPRGVGERRFFVRLFYEGCRGSPRLFPDPLMRRNFFERGELAALEFDVSNPNSTDLRVEFLLAPLDRPQERIKVGEGVAKAGQVTRLGLEVDTSRLRPALYLVVARVEGVGELTSNTAPFRQTNLDAYPWLLAVLEGPVEWEAPASGLPRLIVPEGLGVNIHFAAPSPLEERDLDMIRYAGFRLVRMDLFWQAVERDRGSYDFSGYDALTRALRARGLRPLYILDYGNPLYDNGQPPRSREAVAAFAGYARAAALRYGDYALWEVWNEPNGAFWKPPSAAEYAQLALATARAVKEACPRCVVLAPATAGVDVDFVRQVAALGLLGAIDAVSVHPYRGGPPETALGDYRRLSLVAGNRTVVCSEWGYPTGGTYANRVDVVTQAHYAVRIYLVNLAAGVPVTIIYDWKDDGLSPEDSEQNFGLVAHHLRGPEWFFIKPAYYALYTFARELAGFALKDFRAEGGVYVARFERDGAAKLVVWTEGPERVAGVSVGSPRAVLVHPFGLREEVEAPGGVLRVTAKGAPIIVIPGG